MPKLKVTQAASRALYEATKAKIPGDYPYPIDQPFVEVDISPGVMDRLQNQQLPGENPSETILRLIQSSKFMG